MNANKLKILVVDDNETHRKAAVAQLGTENDLTVVGSYAKAEELISGGGWNGEEKKLMLHGFDMVLVDLLMPAPSTQQGSVGKKYVGQEMPLGIFLVILAAKFGAKYVGLYTDMNHHDHPASACLDPFGIGGGCPQIAGAKFSLWSDTDTFEDDHVTKANYNASRDDNGVLKPGFVQAKNWAVLASDLTD